jgi:P4 family phage/plasmid primase-like protien
MPIAEMKGWGENRETLTSTYNDPRLLEHVVANGNNYGVVTDADRFVVAADTKDVEFAIEQRLPKTFSVRSPRHKIKHFYFYGKLSRTIICKPTTEGDPCADIKTGNAYVLGPKSIFGTYGEYKIIDDVPIATITEEELVAAIDEFILPKKETSFLSTTEGKTDKNLNFPIVGILPNLDAFTQNGNELFGPHPLHGSTTGANFHVNTEKNVWHCFRSGHDSGGGPLELLAVLNGIIKCEDCHKGALRAKLFKDTLTLAKEKGLVTITPPQFEGEVEEDEESAKMREVVTNLQNQFTFKTPDDIEEIYCFNNGVYEEAETKIKGLVENWLGTEVSSHFIEEVLGHIRRSSYVKRTEFNKASAIIPVQNGLLDLDTGTVGPFDKDKIFTYKLNAVYDPTKTCPKFLKTVNEWLDKQDIPTLQEVSGYCLLPAMPFHHLFFLHGVGRNGKTSYVLTLAALFGRENCENLNLEEFDGNHRFSIALLYGKMINTSSEPSVMKQLQTPLLKKLCGEDELTAEVKNKQKRIKFVNTAKMIILGNRFPRVNDNTLAFWDRVVILKFPFSFIGPKKILDISKTWTKDADEMSGILNWMIEGLHRLNENNQFTISKSTEETKLEFQRASDTTLAFLNECCEQIKDCENIKVDFYELYKVYCEKRGVDVDPYGMFASKLKQQLYIRSARPYIEGKREHIWVGVKFKGYPEEEPEEEKEAKKNQQKLDAAGPPSPTRPPFYYSETLREKIGIKIELEKGGPLEPVGPVKPDSNLVGLIPCPECRAKGKPMFFGSDVDLRTHMLACHGSQDYVL